MGKLIDLTGKTFGRLKVIRRKLHECYINGEAMWECECSCSKKSIVYVAGSLLRQGHKSSCGCIWKPDHYEFLVKIKHRLVKYSEMNGQCLEWVGFRDKSGYGHICITKNGIDKPEKAHRASWMVHMGPIPPNMCVLHKCDNPACHRIEHLFLGTHQDNMADKVRKGRHKVLRGADRKNSKLRPKKVKEILESKGKGQTSHQLAIKYDVSASPIRQIWQRRSWKYVKSKEIK